MDSSSNRPSFAEKWAISFSINERGTFSQTANCGRRRYVKNIEKISGSKGKSGLLAVRIMKDKGTFFKIDRVSKIAGLWHLKAAVRAVWIADVVIMKITKLQGVVAIRAGQNVAYMVDTGFGAASGWVNTIKNLGIGILAQHTGNRIVAIKNHGGVFGKIILDFIKDKFAVSIPFNGIPKQVGAENIGRSKILINVLRGTLVHFQNDYIGSNPTAYGGIGA